MKKVPVLLVVLTLATGAILAQNKSDKPAKPKPVVDCSSVDDAKLAADVKARLAAAASLKDLAINVAASSGVVTLTGTAMKGTQKGTATRVAKAVKCVTRVDNQMTVEGAAAKKPAKPKSSSKM